MAGTLRAAAPGAAAFGSAPRATALFTGAGLSHAAPSGLPLGDVFHRDLRELTWRRAAPFLADLVDRDMVDALRESKCNLLARIENTAPGSGAAALACMSVRIPNEAQLLAAVHLALGGIHVTMNFDDGIERAFALLAGDLELPAIATPAQRDALAAWRASLPAARPELTVASRPGSIARSLGRRPLLVKLHGSMGRHRDGVTLPAAAITDDPDAGDLGGERRLAIEALAAEGFVLVTGYSGTDLASRSALLAQLAPGRFWWVAPAVDRTVRRLVSAIDAGQPMFGHAVEAIRSILPVHPPAWPAEADPRFEDRIALWAERLPPPVAAESLAWALADAGQPDVAVAILQRLCAVDAEPRTRMRLADALVRRRWRGDVAASRRIMLRVAATSDRRGLRAYALARWGEAGVDGSQAPRAISNTARAMIHAATAVLPAAAFRRRGRSRQGTAVRAGTIALGRLLDVLEGGLAGARPSGVRLLAILHAAQMGASASGRLLRAWRHAPSGRRGALLERQQIELEAIVALLGGGPVPPGACATLDRLIEVFEHVAEPSAAADAAGTQALLAIAEGDGPGALDAIHRAARWRPDVIGVVALATQLASRLPSITVAPPAPQAEPAAVAYPARRPESSADARLGSVRRSRTPRPVGPSPLEAFVRCLPKVELHVHVDGSVSPGLLATLARRNDDHRVPWTEAGVAAWLRYTGYRDFLNAHVLVRDQLRRPDDVAAVVMELGQSLADQHVRYAEVAISPIAHVRRGVPIHELFAALDDSRRTVERQCGVRLRWCATAGTRLGPRQAMETVEAALEHRASGVVSLGLAGLESAASRSRFRGAFDLARDAGLHRVVHAGEAGGPESIRQAIDELGAERIGHGIRCLEDPRLVDRLRDAGVPLEVCPTSNVRTGLVPTLRRHPLPRLLDAGLRVSLNTDDPAMFGTTLVDEYVGVSRAFRFSLAELVDLARSAVFAAFLDPADASSILAEIAETPIPARPSTREVEVADNSPSMVLA